MQKRIVLTGSNGLLGQKIVPLLADRMNVNLMATSTGINRHPLREGYVYETADLTDFERWTEIFEDFRPTELIHTAAITNVDHCEDDRSLCDAVNVAAVENLVRLCAQYGTRMIHISTDFVFSGESGPYRETDLTGPVNYYGQSKLQAENRILESRIPSTILRTMLLYGITPGMSRTNIVLWAKKSLEEGVSIRVVNDQFRCPTLAEDLASATVTAVMKNSRGLYHISGAEMMSMTELVYQVADFWGLDKSRVTEVTSDSLNQKAKRPPRTGFIILKAQTELDYNPHPFRQGLQLLDQQMKSL
ncbi:MAG: SDR family oxidoreductase [Bacteroidia bacterium]|nr:SDR family oxidoreductase [Bacteroidia bacterium]